MIIAGLTGGIGHGKTTFADLLAAHGRHTAHFESWEVVAEIANNLHHERTNYPRFNDLASINQWLSPLADLIALQVHSTVSFSDLQLTKQRVVQHPAHYAKLFEYLQLMQAYPELAAATITTETKETFRPLLQWLGGYLVITVGNGVWYDEIVRRITHLKGVDIVTVGGVRYPSDAERLRNAGGAILEIIRPDKPVQDAQDLTERQRQLIEADSRIINSGTLHQLEVCAKQVYRDLSLRQLQGKYDAATL